MDKKHWIFISPHFDDVALSCGGLVWELTQQDHAVEVWTIMGGFPADDVYSDFAQQNHLAWGMSGEAAVRMRRAEDHAACEILGAQARHFSWPDVIYRQDPDTGNAMVHDNEELFGKPPEPWLVEAISGMLEEKVPEGTLLVLPIGLGGHIDHRTVVLAGKRYRREKRYYADYPYILNDFSNPLINDGTYIKQPHNLSEDALKAWQSSVLSYASQLSTFWRNKTESRLALRNYMAGGGGRLWQGVN